MRADSGEYSSPGYRYHAAPRIALLWVVAILVVGLDTGPVHGQSADRVPVVRFHVGGAELLPMVYPDRYGGDPQALTEDVEWVRDNADELVEWWDRDGLLFLQRVTDFTGLRWPYRDIDVYLVRHWPVVSIERPLVIALEAIRAGGRAVPVPEDDDVRILLLAHQITHYIVDRPDFRPSSPFDSAYEHPFMAPGNFEAEAMVNWLTYRAIEDLWGRKRLFAATSDEIWQAYNPNHSYVIDELEPRHRLSRQRPLTEWLADNPRGSEIFRVRDAYARQASTPSAQPAAERERVTGTDYGLDLGASHDGRIFVAYVDAASPAGRVGVQQGDVVRTIEGREVGTDVVSAQQQMDASWADNGEINLSVERQGREIFFSIEAS